MVETYSDTGGVPGDSGENRSAGGLPEPPPPPGELMGHMGLGGKREGRPAWAGRPHPPLVRIGLGGGAAPPLSFPLSPFLPPPSRSRIPAFLVLLGGEREGRKGEEEEKERGARPPP